MNKKWMPHIVAVMALVVFIVLGLACASSGSARETLPQTAVTIQRVRVTATLLGEILGAENAELDIPMKVFIDNNEPLELANGEAKTILVNNGEHIVYAVLGNVESKSVKFTAKSQTISVNISTNKNFLGRISLDLVVK